MSTDPRTELRDMIAERVADLTYRGRQLPPGHARAVADSVVALFGRVRYAGLDALSLVAVIHLEDEDG